MELANAAFPYAGEVGLATAALLTLMVYSYLVWADNLLFRLAAHILVGVAVGYAGVVAVHNVLIPRLLAISGDLTLLVPFLFCLFLMVRPARAVAWFSNYPMALILGVGAALAIVGALGGTLIPQVAATTRPFSLADPLAVVNALIMVVGVIATLLSFYFTARREGRGERLLRTLRVRPVGRFFIAVALGALFASLLVSRLSLLVGRIDFLAEFAGLTLRHLGFGI